MGGRFSLRKTRVDPVCAALEETTAQIASSTVRAPLSPLTVESARAVCDRDFLTENRAVHSRFSGSTVSAKSMPLTALLSG